MCFILEYMIVVDVLIMVLLGYGLYKGFRNGLIISVTSLIALIAGIYFSLRFSFYTRTLLEEHFQWNPNATTVAAFFITFVIVLIVLHLLGKLLTRIIETLALGFINRLAGALFEGIKALLIISVLLNLFQKINQNALIVSEEQLNESVFYRPIEEVSRYIFPLMEEWYELGRKEVDKL
ncbi:MAG TPA: CvpA family protein [Flavobacterium sp.]|nr:CvpA family protein [Flavobacterium sp.]